MKRKLFLTVFCAVLSSAASAHKGKLDSSGGHPCIAGNAVCKGYDYHYHKNGGIVYGKKSNAQDGEGSAPELTAFDYSKKSDYITYNNRLKYKKIKEVIEGNEVTSVVLMQRLSELEVSRFAKYLLEVKKEQSFVNIYLQEQSEKEDRVLIELDKERDLLDESLNDKEPWAIYKDGKLTINGLSLNDYKKLKVKTANLKSHLISAWIDPVRKLKYEIYEGKDSYLLAEVSLSSVLVKEVSLDTEGVMIKVNLPESEKNEYYLFGQIGNNEVEFYSEGKFKYKMDKVKRNFD